jgi:hypothetical protein
MANDQWLNEPMTNEPMKRWLSVPLLLCQRDFFGSLVARPVPHAQLYRFGVGGQLAQVHDDDFVRLVKDAIFAGGSVLSTRIGPTTCSAVCGSSGLAMRSLATIFSQ